MINNQEPHCEIIEITNVDFFYMIDNQIRKTMPLFEVGVCLPKAEELLKKCGVNESELRDYPIEGYYYKTPLLKKYFKIIRNLQHNKEVYSKINDAPNWEKSRSLEFLQKICHNDIFGEEKDYKIRDWDGAPLRRRYDILTLTMDDESLFDNMSARPWTIQDIMNKLKHHYKGRANLVELAYLTGEPKCLCSGAETNSLYRMFAMVSGCYFAPKIIEYVWKVDKELEELGDKIIKAYNNLIGSNMVIPSIFNHTSLDNKCETPRVAVLGQVLATQEYYHWIIKPDGYFYDEYNINLITTESLDKPNG